MALSLRAAFSTLAILATAARVTNAADTPEATTLPGLVSEIPPCVAGCLAAIHGAVGCDAANLKCLCSNSSSVVFKMGLCLVANRCGSEAEVGSDLLKPICDKIDQNPSSAEVESASRALATAIATQTYVDAAAATQDSPKDNAAEVIGSDILKAMAAGVVVAFAL